MDINVGDVVRMKKKHPCGSDQWQVVRVVLSEGGGAADQDAPGVIYGSS